MRFEYPFRSRYATVDGIRLHYLDEGQGPPVWLMHGMPMWSYVYRRLIPPLVAAGYRCFVPDLMGFGLSAKPGDERAHMLQRHVDLMRGLVDLLALRDLTLVGQDWGGPIVMRYAIAEPDNVRAIALLNTFVQRFPASRRERRREDIITGTLPGPYPLLFKSGALSSCLVERFDVFRRFVWLKWRTGNGSRLLGAGFRRPVAPEAMRNYREPHSDPAARCGISAFAKMIPDRPDHPNAAAIDAIRARLEGWDIPFIAIWPDGDMAWKPDEGRRIAALVPGGEFHLIRNAGHYLQEDAGEEVAARLIRFLDERAWGRSRPEPLSAG